MDNQEQNQITLPSRFNFAEVEEKWLKYWERHHLFHAQPDGHKKPYCIVIPPPNITGILHMGHALNNTLQDIMIRYKRMQGYVSCWMPGTDHAGIATQNVVEKELSQEGKNRFDVGREGLLKRLWDWKKKYGDTIIHQLKKLGSSCDWPRMRFTLDEAYNETVKYVFVHLYQKGFIYRGKYIINWCPRCQTALSDEEAEHRELKGSLYYIRYPFKDHQQEGVVVATTRPETMLGDTAVAVHPQDARYRHLIGRSLLLPILNREIKVIADEFVNPEFGTGAVKVTPAHDPNDFEMGQRHKLESINILHPDARLNDKTGTFSGMDRVAARRAVCKTLQDLQLLVKTEDHLHSVGHCYRCQTVVEPYLSEQWFVKMKPLAQPAIEAVRNGKIKFYPERWTKVYLNWMENIRDWCISRQIWWGHRIPVWYCLGDDRCTLKCQEPIVSLTPPEQCPHCGSKNLKQDEDVLDTWFSSWLWPFATFGWPKKNKDLEYFYPTSALFTASEIIFFWVARMIVAGLEFTGQIPFSDVYIHGTVRDAKRKKMSKSLGNAIDPLEMIREYGADSLRFSLIMNSGQDLYISKDKFEIGRNFANKIWNASRLILMNIPDFPEPLDSLNQLNFKSLDLPSRWIVSRFHSTLSEVNQALESYRFSEAEILIFEFFWKTYCDWYLEIIKNRFSTSEVRIISLFLLEQSLRMIHPFMPFVTEEIWSHLKTHEGSLTWQRWPVVQEDFIDKKAEDEMKVLIDIITTIRRIRSHWNIKPHQTVNCVLGSLSSGDRFFLAAQEDSLKLLAKIQELKIVDQKFSLKNTATGLIGRIKISIPLNGIIQVETEKKRLQTQLEEIKKSRVSLGQRLASQEFLSRAPGDIVEKEKSHLKDLEIKRLELEQILNNLEY